MPYDPTTRRNSGARTNYLKSYQYDDVDQPYVASPEVPIEEPVKRKRGRPRKVLPIPPPVFTAVRPSPALIKIPIAPPPVIIQQNEFVSNDIYFVAAMRSVGIMYDRISGPNDHMMFHYKTMPRETEAAFYSGKLLVSAIVFADSLRFIRRVSKTRIV